MAALAVPVLRAVARKPQLMPRQHLAMLVAASGSCTEAQRGLATARGFNGATSLQEVEMVDLYKVLGLTKSATRTEIKARYRELAKLHHPDVQSDDKDPELFIAMNEAYEVLGDEAKRREYDLEQAKLLDQIRMKNEGNAWTQANDEEYRKSRYAAASKLRADVTQRGYEHRQHRQKVHIPTKQATYWRMAYPLGVVALWGFNYWYFHYLW